MATGVIIKAEGGGGGGGMMPLSDVIDHPVDNNKKEPASTSGSSQESSGTGTGPLSPEKKQVHIKIAQNHLQQQQQAEPEVEDSSASKVFRKDKSPELQNPAKHASDEWLLSFLLMQYQVSDTVEEKVEILQNLENFSHKFENGRDLFQHTGAVKDILIPALNSTNPEIRKQSCAVFAVAGQNNAVVQKIAKDAGAIRSLVHLLAFDPQVRTKALFALSSLLRNFPEAQAKFIHEGGIPALIKVAFSFETRKRCLSLVTDLLTERKYCLIDLENQKQPSNDFELPSGDLIEDPCDEFKVLEKALKDSGWCDVLSDSVKSLGGFDTEDQLLTAEAVGSSLNFCREEVAPYSKIFQGLLVKFEDDEDFQEESLTLRAIIDTISGTGSGARDEL